MRSRKAKILWSRRRTRTVWCDEEATAVVLLDEHPMVLFLFCNMSLRYGDATKDQVRSPVLAINAGHSGGLSNGAYRFRSLKLTASPPLGVIRAAGSRA